MLNLPSVPTSVLKVTSILLVLTSITSIYLIFSHQLLYHSQKATVAAESEEEVALRELQAAMYA